MVIPIALTLAEGNDVWGAWGLTGAIFWMVIGGIALAGIVFSTISKIMITRAREQTKREIAAYVAEGSIDPKDAVKMLKAGRPPGEIAVSAEPWKDEK